MEQNAFSYEDIIACGKQRVFGAGNAQLPLPPMLMFDRITHVSKQGGLYDRGEITAELDIKSDAWFFGCHFEGDPVMPGCLGLDAMWQLVGFYLGWLGAPGRGRALGAGEVKFSGQVMPDSKMLTYQISIKRVIMRKLVMGLADGLVLVDGQVIYHGKDLKVGLFVQPKSSGDKDA